MKDDPVEVRAVDLCRLLGVPREALSDLAKRGIIVKGEKRGLYPLQPSVTRYCQHLRAEMANDGDVAVKRQVEQAQFRSETIPVANVERRWTTKLWNFGSSTLGISRREIRSFQIYLRTTGGLPFSSSDRESGTRARQRLTAKIACPS